MKTVTDVAAITDPMERLVAASDLVRKAETKVERLRNQRDLAILVMLRPFADAVAPTNAARARVKAAYHDGKITQEEYSEALAENRKRRRYDLEVAGVTVQPVNVYEPLGVSRGMVNRLLMRMPDGPLPVVENPEAEARSAATKLPAVEETLTEAKRIRRDAALILMDGRDDDGNEFQPISNADVARITGLTTARIAQLRQEDE